MRINTDAGEDRDAWLRRCMEATGEATKTGAIFTAVRHYVKDKANKERIIENMSSAQVTQLSTPEMPMEREVETRVGREE